MGAKMDDLVARHGAGGGGYDAPTVDASPALATIERLVREIRAERLASGARTGRPSERYRIPCPEPRGPVMNPETTRSRSTGAVGGDPRPCADG